MFIIIYCTKLFVIVAMPQQLLSDLSELSSITKRENV